jgi:hypothetical protein
MTTDMRKHSLSMRLMNIGTLLQVTEIDLIDFDQVIHELRAIEKAWIALERV